MTSENRPVQPRRSLCSCPLCAPTACTRRWTPARTSSAWTWRTRSRSIRKDEGRKLALPLFATGTHPQVEKMARINALSTLHGLKDLQAILETLAPPPALMVPKVKSAEEIQLLDALASTTPHARTSASA